MEHDRKDHLPDAELERLLREMRYDEPVPSADLLARIESDALAYLPVPEPTVARRAEETTLGRIIDWIGRLALPSGLVAAGLTGLWIGLSAGGALGTGGAVVYADELGQRVVNELPVLAGLLPEG